ncbi:MAG TPA: hypothetical protein VK874_07330 [Gaiellaceae bacterium]|nr:hypothetical protein [Gaiellaceae bacterium]
MTPPAIAISAGEARISASGKWCSPAGVIGVQVRQHDAVDVLRREADALELRPDLLLRLDPLADAEAEVRVPPGEVAALSDSGGLARVDEQQALRVLDEERVDRQRLGPPAVEHRVHEAALAGADALALARLDRNGSGLDRVDVHVTLLPRVVLRWCRSPRG